MEKKVKEAIVGIAFGYTDLKLHPFLSSLELTGYKGDIILFTNNKTRFSRQIAFDLSIRVINIDRQLSPVLQLYRTLNWLAQYLHLSKPWAEWHKRSISRSLKTRQRLSLTHLAFVHSFFFLTISRFFMYYNWLLETDYDRIFFTDVNDVIFQGNIFDSFAKNKIVVYEEYEGCSLGNDENNSTWIKKGYGNQVFNEMSAATIFCAGTIMADKQPCFTFLQDFMLEIMKPGKPLHTNGLDQGVLNYLISHQKKDYFLPSKNGEAIFTAALQPEGDILIKNDAIAVKQCSQAPAVVHQYNRHKKLVDFIEHRYFCL